jgi:hypothetical protein
MKPLFLLKYCFIKELKKNLDTGCTCRDVGRWHGGQISRPGFVMQILKSGRRRRIPHRHIQLLKNGLTTKARI